MSIKIPDELKSNLPQTPLGKALGVTPVVMTVVSTLLAGLASSEMTRAQYDRSSAAQQQSKAGDQWSFFQAKRLRGALQRSTLDVLASAALVRPIDPAALRRNAAAFPATPETAAARADLAKLLAEPDAETALQLLQTGELPAHVAPPALDPEIKAVVDLIDQQGPTHEIAARLNRLDSARIEDALRAARAQVTTLDTALAPAAHFIDRLETALRHLQSAAPNDTAAAGMLRDVTVARLRFNAARYDAEARLNQSIGTLHELQVRQSNLAAERHHRRSQRFFYGMLAAQLAVIISTFAIVARQRSLLWSIAAAAGVGAVLFAGYVYLTV